MATRMLCNKTATKAQWIFSNEHLFCCCVHEVQLITARLTQCSRGGWLLAGPAWRPSPGVTAELGSLPHIPLSSRLGERVHMALTKVQNQGQAQSSFAILWERKLRAQRADGDLAWPAHSRCSTKHQWKEHRQTGWGIYPLWVSS